KVNRVEVKNITPPAAIQQAMEKQMKAEREKREAVLLAEGEKQAAITIAEGNKQAMILAAEAHKQQVILSAEADKEKQIREAEGEADAIRNVQMATADGIRVVREAGADNAVLTLKALEALGALANGTATKLIVPSDIQGIAGLAASLKEVFVDDPSVKPSKSAGQDQ
ncbi:MAG: SPFH domain-containing protein, partial [Raoultibacter sp.]